MEYIFLEYLPTHPVQGLFVAGRWEEKTWRDSQNLLLGHISTKCL